MEQSGFYETEVRGDKVHGKIGYGKNMDPPYTLIVHEDLTMQHDAPTTAKFLQIAVEEYDATLRKDFAEKLKRNMMAKVGREFGS